MTPQSEDHGSSGVLSPDGGMGSSRDHAHTDSGARADEGAWFLNDSGEPDYLDGIQSQFDIRTADSGAPVAYAFTAEHGRLIAAAPDLLHEARELCAILDNYNAHDGEGLVYDFEAIGEEMARRHEALTAAIAKATEA